MKLHFVADQDVAFPPRLSSVWRTDKTDPIAANKLTSDCKKIKKRNRMGKKGERGRQVKVSFSVAPTI